MAFDAFLWFDRDQQAIKTYLPEGESSDKCFKGVKAFEIRSFQFGAENKPTIGSQSGGAGAGKATLQEFQISKLTDAGSPKIFGACVAGAHFAKAHLAIRKATGIQEQYPVVKSAADAEKQAYLVYSFSFVYVSRIEWSGNSGDEVPEERVTFVYGALKVHYSGQDGQGKITGPVTEQMWSQVLNQPTEMVI